MENPEGSSTPTPAISTPPVEAPKHSRKLPVPWILGVLVVFLLATTAYLGYQNQQLTQKISQMEQEASPTPSPVTAEADPTADWKTLTFEPIGHTVKYPTDWTAAQCELGIHLFTQPTERGGTSCETPPFGVVFIAFDSKPIETGYLKSTDYVLEEEQNITIPFGQATKRVIKQVNEGPGPTNYIEITFKGTNEYYYLISTENLQYETIIDQILSTFQFID